MGKCEFVSPFLGKIEDGLNLECHVFGKSRQLWEEDFCVDVYAEMVRFRGRSFVINLEARHLMEITEYLPSSNLGGHRSVAVSKSQSSSTTCWPGASNEFLAQTIHFIN